ncbi:MAG: hypothetical protein GEU92_01105 [Alphaproteobacteria bacterium]|nr:hypothetical protein [Alphaproteobacteria bacterium]
MRKLLLSVWIAVAVGAAGVVPDTAGNSAASGFSMLRADDRGRVLVESRCLGCHADADVVALAPGARAPGLAEIAERYRNRPAEIVDILLNRHPPMPRSLLRDDEINDIVAYIGTLDGS